jgi:hypothetical protein
VLWSCPHPFVRVVPWKGTTANERQLFHVPLPKLSECQRTSPRTILSIVTSATMYEGVPLAK